MSAADSQKAWLAAELSAAVAAEREAARRRRRASNCWKGAEGELRVCRRLSQLALSGFHHLDDRRLIESSGANIDHLVVGPTGVFVVDAKNWTARTELRGGSLYQQGRRRDDKVLTASLTAVRVDEFLALSSAPLLTATAVISLPPSHAITGTVGRIEVTTDDQLLDCLVRRPRVLTGEQVEEILDLLAGAFPPYDVDSHEKALVDGLLFPELETRHAGLHAALKRPIEDWMIWLHPEQAKLVRTSYPGPVRIRGAAGTGKTTVGLHRVHQLAAARTGRFLVTSFLRSLSPVFAELYRRLSPATADRVEFANLHRVALDILRSRGQAPRLDGGQAATAFNVAWAKNRHNLDDAGLEQEYYREEVDYVIKGRGLSSLDQYLRLNRRGRRTPLPAAARTAVWRLYERYEQELQYRRIVDFMDVLRLARDELRRVPLEPAYTGVLVDEVQDLPLIGLQLCHELAGRDRADGLTLVGDGQQSVYPGSYTLSEAGINVAGRAFVLKANYRNTVEILAAASGLVSADSFEDLEDAVGDGIREVEVIRHGPVPITGYATSLEQHDRLLRDALLAALAEPDVHHGDVAVLLPTNRLCDTYAKLLASWRLSIQPLVEWHGQDVERIKIGTYQRSKGLEFKQVLLPRADTYIAAITGSGPAAVSEREELARRRLYVAMTRARDGLWIGHLLPAPRNSERREGAEQP